MQINNIINLATSASGPAASPLAGSRKGDAISKADTSGFNDFVADPAVDTYEFANDALPINDPQGGVIPIPQIYDAAHFIPQLPAEQYIDLSNGGIVEQSALQGIFGAVESPLAGIVPTDAAELPVLQLAGKPQLPATPELTLQNGFPVANELKNSSLADDASFDEQLVALQNSIAKGADPKKVESAFEQLVASAGDSAKNIAPKDMDAAQKIVDEYFAKQLGSQEADEAAANKIVQANADSAATKMVSGAAATATTLQSLSAKVGQDYAAFDSKPIDVNEIAFGAKVNDLASSKLEAQIKVLESEQIMRSPVEQIKVKVAQGLELGMDKVTIKLHPAELGKVNVEMDLDKDGKAHVRIVADRSETLDFLRRDSSDLQKSLRDVGVNADGSNLEFSLNQESKGESFGDQAESSGFNSEVSEEYSTNIPQTDAEIYMAVTEGGLNLVV